MGIFLGIGSDRRGFIQSVVGGKEPIRVPLYSDCAAGCGHGVLVFM